MIKKLGKDVAIYGGGDFVFKAIAFAVFPVYAHYFNVGDFGVWALLTVSASLVGIFINLGINNSVQRYYWDPETTTAQQPAIVSGGLFQLTGFGLLFLLLVLSGLFFKQEWIETRYGAAWSLIALVGINMLFEQLLQYTLDTLRLHFAPVRFLIISFAKNLLGVGLGLWFVIKLRWGIYGYFWGAAIGAGVALPIALWFIRQELTWQLNRQISIKIFRFGFPFVFAGIAYWVFGSMDRWVLAELSTIEEVGLYSIAFKFAAIVGFLITAFAQAWSPLAIKLLRDNPGYRAIYSRIFTVWFFFLALAGLTISLFAREALIILTPKDYWPAANVLIVVTAGTVIYGTTQLTSIGISLEKKTHLLTWGAVTAAVANLLLNLLLVPRFGAIGSGIATLLSYSLLTLSFLYHTQRIHPLPLENVKLLYSCFTVAFSVCITFLFSGSYNGIFSILLRLGILMVVIVGGIGFGIIEKEHLLVFKRFKFLWAK